MTTTTAPPSTSGSIGFLHPGEMGSALATLVKSNGFTCYWLAQGRSDATRNRALRAAMTEVATLEAFCQHSGIIISICPPHAAMDVARQVAGQGFAGVYIDANAISPTHARQMNDIIALGGGRFVDAAIVGPPPGKSTDTRLYLSGEPVAEVARCFTSPGLKIINLGAEIGRASSLKMCHSAMHKGQLAMLIATLAGAQSLGVRHELTELWGAKANTADLARGMDENFRRLAKAWRFAGEMDEVADTFASAGLPAEFHVAAAEIFSRLSTLPDAATKTQVFELLLDTTPSKPR